MRLFWKVRIQSGAAFQGKIHMETEIRNVSVDKIEANPWRNLATYPPIRQKVDALKNSIGAVGMWESIIVRQHPTKPAYQQAFGHQRIFAAKELGLKIVPVIVRDLSDEQMLQFLGRENGEDYGTLFSVMLNTWEAGRDFLSVGQKKPQNVEIARLLGWTRPQPQDGKVYDVMQNIATTCAGALTLIEGGYVERSAFDDLPVHAAREIVGRGLTRMEQIEKAAKIQHAPVKEKEQAKRHVATGVKQTIRDVKEGKVAHREIRTTVDTHTMQAAGKEAKDSSRLPPLFSQFCQTLTDTLARTLNGDTISERLRQIAEVIDYVVEPEHKASLRKVTRELDEVSTRARDWNGRLDPDRVKPFPAAVQIGGRKDDQL